MASDKISEQMAVKILSLYRYKSLLVLFQKHMVQPRSLLERKEL